MFKRIWSGLFQQSKSLPSGQLRSDVDQREIASRYPIDSLVPIILPPEILTSDWPAITVPLGDLPFVLAWAVMTEPKRFLYVDKEAQAVWDSSGVDWRACAKQNLRRIALRFPFYAKFDEHGVPFVQALITEDAIGPSRLLIPGLFQEHFGDDYMVAIPEETCAIVYRRDLTAEQRVEVDNWIDGCYRVGTKPMTPDRFRADRFWVL